MRFPVNETERLAAAEDYLAVGLDADADFDAIVQMASELVAAPIGLVSIMGRDQLFPKGRVNFGGACVDRDVAFCDHTIAAGELLVVPDLLEDPRFSDNPLVTAADPIRFYAGAPLKTADGLNVGSLCVLDRVPHKELTEEQRSGMQRLAKIAMQLFEKRRLGEMKDAAMSFAAAIPDAVICIDDAMIIRFWNPAAAALFGMQRRHACGRPLGSFLTPVSEAALEQKLRNTTRRSSAGAPAFGLDCRKASGQRFTAEATLAHWVENGRACNGLIIRDLSQTKLIRDHVKYLTTHDRLTDLPNRAMFIQGVDEAIADGKQLTVVKIGLDRFTTVNGGLGIAAGDDVLKQVAERIRHLIGSEVLIARLGGDEFGALLVGDGDDVDQLSMDIISTIARPFSTFGLKAELTASIGLAQSFEPSEEGIDAVAYVKRALLALYEAKQAGGNRASSYSQSLERAQVERHSLLADMRRGFLAGEFELYYQPQVDVASGKIVGAEALLRWNHLERGLVSPGSFITALEVSDIALEVGGWIVGTAASFASKFVKSVPGFTMGVNLFAAQLRSPQLSKEVAEAIKFAGIPPSALELEITETTVLGTDGQTLDQLRELRSLGVGLAFDDYGTGYASLSLLKKYPLTRLKIDREFVRDLTEDADDEAIINAVIALGKSLGLDVIAEGVETTEQLERLSVLGCPHVQGYLCGKPMPGLEFVNRIETQSGKAA